MIDFRNWYKIRVVILLFKYFWKYSCYHNSSTDDICSKSNLQPDSNQKHAIVSKLLEPTDILPRLDTNGKNN